MGLLVVHCTEWKKGHWQFFAVKFVNKNVGRIPWNVIPICETFKISCPMGRLHTKHVLEIFLKDKSLRCVLWLCITPFVRKTSENFINLSKKKKSLPWIVPWIRSVRGRKLKGWHIDCTHWGVGNDGRIRNLLWNTQCKGSDISEKKNHISSRRWTNEICWRKSGTENILLNREHPIRRESHEHFLGGSLPSLQDSLPDACEATKDFWSISRNFIFRHHVEPRVKLYSPREESFPIPLKYIDVSRTTHTNLDVKQEKRIDDYWNIDGSRGLSDPWTGFTQFTLLEEKPPDGYRWSGWRLTRKQLTSRPDHSWPEICTKLRRNVQLKERQKWSYEKKCQKITRNLIHWPWEQEVQRNHQKCSQEIGNTSGLRYALQNKQEIQMWSDRWQIQWTKSKLVCILETSEPTKLRVGESLPNHHEDHIAGKGTIHCNIKFWYTNLFPCLEPRRFRKQKQRWRRNGKNWKIPEKFILPHWWTSVIWWMPNWRQNTTNTKVELYSGAILWKMILDLMQYSLNKGHQHHKWQQK